jgi:hypothetical protein
MDIPIRVRAKSFISVVRKTIAANVAWIGCGASTHELPCGISFGGDRGHWHLIRHDVSGLARHNHSRIWWIKG